MIKIILLTLFSISLFAKNLIMPVNNFKVDGSVTDLVYKNGKIYVSTDASCVDIIDEKTKKIKKKVYATINHYKKSAGSRLLLTYRITDVKSGQILFSGTVNTDAKFFHEWATYEGDKRALSSQYGLLVIREEQFAPSRSELYMKAAGKLPNQLMQTISDHYSN